MKFENLSNGQSDGVVLFYMKGGKLMPIALNMEQAKLLDISITIPFKDDKMVVDSKSNINVVNGVLQ